MSKVRSMGPWYGPLAFEGILKGKNRVYIRYTRIPGLRAHTRGPWVHPKNMGVSENWGVPYFGVLIIRILLFRVLQ